MKVWNVHVHARYDPFPFAFSWNNGSLGLAASAAGWEVVLFWIAAVRYPMDSCAFGLLKERS